MPVIPNAEIEISALRWAPPFAQGLVRDLRVRWALEEASLPYRERLLDVFSPRPDDYFLEQPFGQVPIYNEGPVRMFETGAIVLHVSERSETLMPRDPAGRARAMSWVLAALNSVEPFVQQLASMDIFHADKPWAAGAREHALEFSRRRLDLLSQRLGERDHLEDRFTAGDLVMVSVLRILRGTELAGAHANLAAYQARCEARPAFQRALADQIAPFALNAPAQAA